MIVINEEIAVQCNINLCKTEIELTLSLYNIKDCKIISLNV